MDSIESRLIRIESDLVALRDTVNERHNLVLTEMNKLKDNYARHDKDLVRIAVSIENMVKELTSQRNELMEAVIVTQKRIETHLREEDLQRKKTIDEIKGVGWKVITAILLGAAALLFDIPRGA